jgi:hypothetical protein
MFNFIYKMKPSNHQSLIFRPIQDPNPIHGPYQVHTRSFYLATGYMSGSGRVCGLEGVVCPYQLTEYIVIFLYDYPRKCPGACAGRRRFSGRATRVFLPRGGRTKCRAWCGSVLWLSRAGRLYVVGWLHFPRGLGGMEQRAECERIR